MIDNYRVNIEPDTGGPSPWRRRIVASAPVPHTKTGKRHTLECGHEIMTFGNLDHLGGLSPLCVQCRDAAQPPAN